MTPRRYLTTILVAAIFAAAASAAVGVAADRPGHFLSGFEDLPLMDGLSEQADAGVVFDKPDGRIIERYASGPLSFDSVYAFYRDTLPQLGWHPRPAKSPRQLLFEREGESLDIEFKFAGSELIARFVVTPQ
jgi:hypothetical protein